MLKDMVAVVASSRFVLLPREYVVVDSSDVFACLIVQDPQLGALDKDVVSPYHLDMYRRILRSMDSSASHMWRRVSDRVFAITVRVRMSGI